MTQENVELAGRVLDALARRDVSRLVELSDPEDRWYVRDLKDAWEIVRADVDDGLGV